MFLYLIISLSIYCKFFIILSLKLTREPSISMFTPTPDDCWLDIEVGIFVGVIVVIVSFIVLFTLFCTFSFAILNILPNIPPVWLNILSFETISVWPLFFAYLIKPSDTPIIINIINGIRFFIFTLIYLTYNY